MMYIIGQVRWQLQGIFYILSNVMNFTLIYRRLKIGSEFCPSSVFGSRPALRKIWILLHCQASQVEIRKQNSTTLCQTVDSKSR